MMDCAGDDAHQLIEGKIGDDVRAVGILNEMLKNDESGARKYLMKQGFSSQKIEKIIEKSYCKSPPEGFFIASNDMIGKSGVWSHFGSWSFERADIWYNVRPKAHDDGVAYLVNKYNYTKDKAESMYYEVTSISADQGNQWVAPWPGYGGDVSCPSDPSGRVE